MQQRDIYELFEVELLTVVVFILFVCVCVT
jgi:hypothetical protein